jgi:hypothetical protein
MLGLGAAFDDAAQGWSTVGFLSNGCSVAIAITIAAIIIIAVRRGNSCSSPIPFLTLVVLDFSASIAGGFNSCCFSSCAEASGFSNGCTQSLTRSHAHLGKRMTQLRGVSEEKDEYHD